MGHVRRQRTACNSLPKPQHGPSAAAKHAHIKVFLKLVPAPMTCLFLPSPADTVTELMTWYYDRPSCSSSKENSDFR